MLKAIIAAAVALFISVSATFAQQPQKMDIPTPCWNTDQMLKMMQDDKFRGIILMPDAMVFANPDGAVLIVKPHKDKVCVAAISENARFHVAIDLDKVFAQTKTEE